MSNDLVSALSEASQRMLNEPQASLLNGILFGSQAKLPSDLTQALRITGTLHVVAVSGQNMSILAGFVGKTFQTLSWRLSLALEGTAIIGYMALVGGGGSVIRSGLMALIALFAKVTGRQAEAGRALALTAILMVLVHPEFLGEIGWQLSVLATAGIVWLEPIIALWVKKVPRVLADLVSVSLSAQLLTWPIIAYYFGIFSLISLPANILVEWSVPWIMGLGSLSLIVAQLSPVVGQILSWLVWVPLSYFVLMIYELAKVPLASLNLPAIPLGIIVLFYTAVGGGFWWFRKKEL